MFARFLPTRLASWWHDSKATPSPAQSNPAPQPVPAAAVVDSTTSLEPDDQNKDDEFEAGVLVRGVSPNDLKPDELIATPLPFSPLTEGSAPSSQGPADEAKLKSNDENTAAGDSTAESALRARIATEGSTLAPIPAAQSTSVAINLSGLSLNTRMRLDLSPSSSSSSDSNSSNSPLLGARSRPTSPPAVAYRNLSDICFYGGIFFGMAANSMNYLPIILQVTRAGAIAALGTGLSLACHGEQVRLKLLYTATGSAMITTSLQYAIGGSVGFWAVPLTFVGLKIAAPRVQPFAANMINWWQSRARTDSERKKYDLEPKEQARDDRSAQATPH